MPTILRSVGESEILSTTPSPTLRQRPRRRRFSSKRRSFTTTSKTGLPRTIRPLRSETLTLVGGEKPKHVHSLTPGCRVRKMKRPETPHLHYYYYDRPNHLALGEMWFGGHFQTTEHQAGSHRTRASRSAGAGPATSRIVPWPNIPKMTYDTEIANTGASAGA